MSSQVWYESLDEPLG